MNTATLAVIFSLVSQEMHLPKGLLSALCWVESKHKVNAVHQDDGTEDSVGICQLHLSTAQWMGFRGTARDLHRPEVNIKYAGLYLRYQIKRHKGNIPQAVASYNAGRVNLTPSGEFRNQRYVTLVSSAWRSKK